MILLDGFDSKDILGELRVLFHDADEGQGVDNRGIPQFFGQGVRRPEPDVGLARPGRQGQGEEAGRVNFRDAAQAAFRDLRAPGICYPPTLRHPGDAGKRIGSEIGQGLKAHSFHVDGVQAIPGDQNREDAAQLQPIIGKREVLGIAVVDGIDEILPAALVQGTGPLRKQSSHILPNLFLGCAIVCPKGGARTPILYFRVMPTHRLHAEEGVERLRTLLLQGKRKEGGRERVVHSLSLPREVLLKLEGSLSRIVGQGRGLDVESDIL